MILIVLILALLQILPQTMITPAPPKYYSSNIDSDSVIVQFGFINHLDRTLVGGASSINVKTFKDGVTHELKWPWKLDGTLFEYELLLRILPSTYFVVNNYVDNGTLCPANWGVPVTIYPGQSPKNPIIAPPSHYLKPVHYSSELSVITDADSIVVNCVFNTLAAIDRVGGVESVYVMYYKEGHVLKQSHWPYLSDYKSFNQEILFNYIPSTYYIVKKEMDDGVIPNSPMYSVSFTILPKWMVDAEESTSNKLKQIELIKRIEKTYDDY